MNSFSFYAVKAIFEIILIPFLFDSLLESNFFFYLEEVKYRVGSKHDYQSFRLHVAQVLSHLQLQNTSVCI